MPIDVNWIRKEKGFDPDEVRKSEERRKPGRSKKTVDVAIEADKVWRNAQFAVEQKRAEAGKIQKQIAEKKKASKGKDACTEELAKKDALLQEEVELAKKAEELAAKRDAVIHKIGNIVKTDVPDAQDEVKNEAFKHWGIPRKIQPDGKTPGRLHHYQIMQALGMYDAERGTKVAGHRGYFLRGHGVMLNMALLNYGLTLLAKRGYTALQPPFFMKQEMMAKTAELNDFHESLYKVSELTDTQKQEYVKECAEKNIPVDPSRGQHYLIATSEQPISAYHAKEVMEPAKLPIRYCGQSSCFRKEAGSHGRDVWGLFRIHQFEKIEQFCITTPDESEKMQDEMLDAAEEFYQSLEVPYRVVKIVSGALNDAAAKKYDLEAWFPGYDEWKELVSISNCTDFQSRALEIKCGQRKQGDDQIKYVHMLNGTLCATERCMCCLVETYQTEKGIRIPRVLQPFMGGVEFLPFTHPIPKKEA